MPKQKTHTGAKKRFKLKKLLQEREDLERVDMLQKPTKEISKSCFQHN